MNAALVREGDAFIERIDGTDRRIYVIIDASHDEHMIAVLFKNGKVNMSVELIRQVYGRVETWTKGNGDFNAQYDLLRSDG